MRCKLLTSKGLCEGGKSGVIEACLGEAKLNMCYFTQKKRQSLDALPRMQVQHVWDVVRVSAVDSCDDFTPRAAAPWWHAVVNLAQAFRNLLHTSVSRSF